MKIITYLRSRFVLAKKDLNKIKASMVKFAVRISTTRSCGFDPQKNKTIHKTFKYTP